MLIVNLVVFVSLIHLCDASSYQCDRSRVPCGCGQTDVGINARIVNGEDAIANSWSMMVSLRRNSSVHHCGGTIVSQSYVLTAAHCVNDYLTGQTFENMSIVAGIHNSSQTNGIIRHVDKIIIHPLWNKLRTEIQYDIALLHLAEPLDLQMNSSLSRTCLPPRPTSRQQLTEYPSNGTRLIAIGWGALGLTRIRPQILQQVTLYSIHHSDKLCSDTIRDPSVDLCAGWDNGTKSACFGDSGGPVFHWLGDRWEQVGIASYMESFCGINNYPSVYTRISYFLDWIESYLNGDNSTSDNITANSRNLYQCSPSNECGCSRRNVVLSPSNFVDIENALPFSWSMVVSVQHRINNEHICSGTILDDFNILTAAHCVLNRSAEDLLIAGGMYYLSEQGTTFRQVRQIVFHPNYTQHGNEYTNDVAILHLSIPFDRYEGKDISHTCLPSNVNRSEDSFVLTGWNMTNNSTLISSHILQQSQILNPNDHSNRSFESHTSIDFESNGCFVLRIDQCQNETFGNPLFQWNGFQWIQLGFASYCDVSRRLTIFTNLTQHSSWIRSTMIPMNRRSSTVFHCDKKATCGCGTSDVNLTVSHVTQSDIAVESSWTMIVSIQDDNVHRCVGTILSNSLILTSSSCVRSFQQIEKLTILHTNKIHRQVEQIYHFQTNLTSEVYQHDLAIIKLRQSFAFDRTQVNLSKTCLLNNDENLFVNSNSSLAIVGWEQMVNNEYLLQQMSIKLIDKNHRSCALLLLNQTYQFCARPANNNPYLFISNLHSNATGGPVMIFVNNRWQQIGIVTESPYYEMDSVRVYTRLSPYINWIQSFIDTDFQTSNSCTLLNHRQQNNLFFILIVFLILM